MKVLVDGRVLRQEYTTGVQRYAREMLKAFAGSGFKYDVAYPKSNNRLFQHVWEHAILPEQAKNYDTLFCPGNIAPLWKPGSVRLVTTLHSMAFVSYASSYSFFFRNYYKAAMPRIIKISDKIITVSESEKKNIEEYYPSVKSKIYVIQNGIGDEFLQQTIGTTKENYILFVGSLNPLKNVKRVIEAFLLIRDKIPHSLRIAGPLPPIFKSENLLSDDRIEFIGAVEDDTALIAQYRKAALFVFPSLYEASPLPPLEAMACSCPVLVSNIPALKERCGDAALYCDPGNTEDIAEKMLEMLNNQTLRSELASKGREHSKQFTWEQAARETIKLLKN